MSTRKEDIYESADGPDGDPNAAFAANEDLDNENIELVHLDIDAAERKFHGKVLNADNVDFSDSIAKKRRYAYGGGAYVLELVGRDVGEPETPEQKLNRLTYEVQELAESLQKNGSEKSEPTLLSAEAVNELLDELKAIRVAITSNQPLPAQKSTAVAPKDKASKSSAEAKSSPALEARLRRLEALVGKTDGNEGAGKPTLADAVEDVRVRVNALNPNFLEAVESRLNSALAKLDQVDERREQSGKSDLQAKVDSLLELMQKWDAACTALPSQLKRLHQLRNLHEQAQAVNGRIAALVGVAEQVSLSLVASMAAQVERAIADDRLAMAELQKTAKEDIQKVVSDLTALDKRVKALGK